MGWVAAGRHEGCGAVGAEGRERTALQPLRSQEGRQPITPPAGAWAHAWAQGLKKALFAGDRRGCVEDFYFFSPPLWVFFNKPGSVVVFPLVTSTKTLLVCRQDVRLDGLGSHSCVFCPCLSWWHMLLPRPCLPLATAKGWTTAWHYEGCIFYCYFIKWSFSLLLCEKHNCSEGRQGWLEESCPGIRSTAGWAVQGTRSFRGKAHTPKRPGILVTPKTWSLNFSPVDWLNRSPRALCYFLPFAPVFWQSIYQCKSSACLVRSTPQLTNTGFEILTFLTG